MATDEDAFDIDIYGDRDTAGEYEEEGQIQDGQHPFQAEVANPLGNPTEISALESNSANDGPNGGGGGGGGGGGEEAVASNMGSIEEPLPENPLPPKQRPQQQGLKRKDGLDDRPVEPGATSALLLSDLPWWMTDDDIRGWANQSECEDELEDITFNEHKVNGKSKGQAYVIFTSPQAATAVKQTTDSFTNNHKFRNKFNVNYSNPSTNPFRSHHKEGVARNAQQANRSSSTGYNAGGATNTPPQTNYNASSGYRGRGGGGYNRGGMNNVGGYNSNRGGIQQPVPGSYQGAGMNGYQGAAATGYQTSPIAMQSYGAFQNHGGMGGMRSSSMGMRGGAGSMTPNGMMSMPMAGMNMGNMPGQMNMGMSPMGGMSMQAPVFQAGQPYYNSYYSGQQLMQPGVMGDASWNPHGAKRTRQE